MKNYLASSLQIALPLAICFSALKTAQASAITTYSDRLDCGGGSVICGGFDFEPPPQPITSLDVDGHYFEGGTFGPLHAFPLASFYASTSVSNFTEQIQCFDVGLQVCNYTWGGDITGGKITMDMSLNLDGSFSNVHFMGTITGGRFDEGYIDSCFPGVCWAQWTDLSFSGQWSNGWKSTGEVEVQSNNSGSGGKMFLYTQTPEPASLCLFGSGMLGVVGVLRRKPIP